MPAKPAVTSVPSIPQVPATRAQASRAWLDMRIPEPPEVQVHHEPAASTEALPFAAPTNQVTQDVPDRMIAHVATGGLIGWPAR